MLRSGAPNPALWVSVEDTSPTQVKGDDLKQEFLASLGAFSQCEQRLLFDSMVRGQLSTKLAALSQYYWLSVVLLETVGSLDLGRRFTGLEAVADVESRRAVASDLAVQYLMSTQAAEAALGSPEAFLADPMMALLHYHEPQATGTYFLLQALQKAASTNEARTRNSLFYRLTPEDTSGVTDASLRAHILAPIARGNTHFQSDLGPPLTGPTIRRDPLPEGVLRRGVHQAFRPPGLESDPTVRDDPETSGGNFPMPATMTAVDARSGTALEEKSDMADPRNNHHKHLVYDSNAYLQHQRLATHRALAAVTTAEGMREEAGGDVVAIDFHPNAYMGEEDPSAPPQTANPAWRKPLLQVLLQTTLNWQIMQNIEERLHDMKHSSDRFVLLAAHAHDSIQTMLSTEDGTARRDRLLNLYLDPEEMATHVPTLEAELQYYLLLLFQAELDSIRLGRAAGGEPSPRLSDIVTSLTEAVAQAGGLTADILSRTTRLFWTHSAPDGFAATVTGKRVRQFVARVLRESYNRLAPAHKRHRGRDQGPRLDLVKDSGVGVDAAAADHAEAITRVIRAVVLVPREADPNQYVQAFMKGEGAESLEAYVKRGMTERVRRVYDRTVEAYRSTALYQTTMMIEEISHVLLEKPERRQEIIDRAPAGSSLGDIYAELIHQLDTTLFVSGPLLSTPPSQEELRATHGRKLAALIVIALTRATLGFQDLPGGGARFQQYQKSIKSENPILLSDTIRMLRTDLPLIGARYYARNKFLYKEPTAARTITLSNAGTDQRPVYAEPDRNLRAGSSRIEIGGRSTLGFSSAWLKRDVITAQTQYMARMASLVDIHSKNPHTIQDLEWEEADERPVEFHMRYEMPREATVARVRWTVNGRSVRSPESVSITTTEDVRSLTTTMSLSVPSAHTLVAGKDAAESSVMYFNKRRPVLTVACAVDFYWYEDMPTGTRASATARVHITTPVRQKLGSRETDLHRATVSSGEQQRRYDIVYDTLLSIERDPRRRNARQKEIDDAYLRQVYNRSWASSSHQRVATPRARDATPTTTLGTGTLSADMGVVFARVESRV